MSVYVLTRIFLMQSKTELPILTREISKDSVIPRLPDKLYFHLHIYIRKMLDKMLTL